MKIGIIETGEPPAALKPQFGTYVSMTRRFLGAGHTFEAFRAVDGCLPNDKQCDAVVITGSACSAYENHTWIRELEDWLRVHRDRTKLIGICFGHQIMAQAFGGKVERSRRGWGLGLHRYAINERAAWMDGVGAIHATASHRDQVVTPPPNTTVLAASDFTPYAILSYKDHPAVSMQFHPEFEPDFSCALFAGRSEPDLTNEAVHYAISTMSSKNDNARISRWVNTFLAL